MNRTGLFVALAIAAVVGTVFGVYPELDIAIERWLFDAAGNGFWIGADHRSIQIRDFAAYLITAIAFVPAVAAIVKLVLPRSRLIVSGRAIILLLGTLALGPGLLTNLVLKDHWGRSRPIDVTQFGGKDTFVSWWDPRGDCPKNCSFVAGEPSGAFWTIAPASFAPPPWRALAYGAALAFGAGMGVLRMGAGGHFFTDVVFAGVLTFLLIWFVHGLLYRWRRTRVSDETVERMFERVAMPGHLLILRGLTRLRLLPRGPGADDRGH